MAFRKIGRSVKRVSRGKAQKMYKKGYKSQGVVNSTNLRRYAGYAKLV